MEILFYELCYFLTYCVYLLYLFLIKFVSFKTCLLNGHLNISDVLLTLSERPSMQIYQHPVARGLPV